MRGGRRCDSTRASSHRSAIGGSLAIGISTTRFAAYFGTSLSPAGGYVGGGIANPNGIAVDISGDVWISNAANNSVTEILGGAVPVTPVTSGVANSTPDAMP